MRQIVILLTGLAVAGTSACTSGSDSVTSPLPLGGVNSAAVKGGNPTVAGSANATGAID